MEGKKILDPEERDYYIAEMLSSSNEPYVLHNRDLAAALYEEALKYSEEASFCELQLQQGSIQWICLTYEAVCRLEERLKKFKASKQKELEMIMAALESIGGVE